MHVCILVYHAIYNMYVRMRLLMTGRYWPKPLVEMVNSLPDEWRIVNAAVSNTNDPMGFTAENPFRQNLGDRDYGTVAVLYNLGPGDVCASVNSKTAFELIQGAKEPCQPAVSTATDVECMLSQCVTVQA